MKQLLEYVIPNIVNHPDAVEITETTDEGNVNLTIKVHPEDTGRVIGKAGKVIKAIRQIARVIAIKQGVRVNIDVLDGQSQAAGSTVFEAPQAEGPGTEVEEAADEAVTEEASTQEEETEDN